MRRKSIPIDEFDEESYLTIVDEYGIAMARGEFSKGRVVAVENNPKEVKQSKVSHKQREQQRYDYESGFLVIKSQKITSKRISINMKYHTIMSRFLSQMGDNKISINNYLNNIIEAHFDQYSDEIEELYKLKRQKKLL